MPLFSTATRPVTVRSRRQTTPGCTLVARSATTSSMVNLTSGFTFISTSSTSRECYRKFNERTSAFVLLSSGFIVVRRRPQICIAKRRQIASIALRKLHRVVGVRQSSSTFVNDSVIRCGITIGENRKLIRMINAMIFMKGGGKERLN